MRAPVRPSKLRSKTSQGQAGVPSPLSVAQQLDVVTGPLAYVRLLGDRDAVDALTPTLDHVVIDRGEQVAADAEPIRLLGRPAREAVIHPW